MKKLFFILGIATLALIDVYGQQVPLWSQSIINNRFIYNPAATGWSESPQVWVMYRRQWVDFEGAPETRAASFDMSLGKKKFGVGGYVYSDITNIFRRYAGYASYAYHLNFKDDHRLSFGIAGGIQDTRVDPDGIFVLEENDVLLTGNRERGTAFDASAGIYYFIKGFHLGISSLQLVDTKLKFLNDDTPTGFSLARHYMATTSYNIGIANRRYFIEPHVAMRSAFDAFDEFQIDAGVTLKYKDWIWIDGTYRYDYGVAIGGGIKAFDVVSIGYSYDLALNEISDYDGGTHEIMLGITFGKGKKNDELEDKVNELAEKVKEQDSLMVEINEELDSLEMTVDSMGQVLDSVGIVVDSVNQAIESGEIGDVKSEQVEELLERIKELEEKLKTVEGQVEENSDLQKEMQEERTRVVDEDDLEYKRGTPIGDYFMVVGSFRIEENSYKYQEQVTKDGFNAGVVYDKKRKWYYVYVATPDDLDKGLEDLYRLREENDEFHDAWIHIMSKSLR